MEFLANILSSVGASPNDETSTIVIILDEPECPESLIY